MKQTNEQKKMLSIGNVLEKYTKKSQLSFDEEIRTNTHRK